MTLRWAAEADFYPLPLKYHLRSIDRLLDTDKEPHIQLRNFPE